MKNYDFVNPYNGETMKACFSKANYQLGNGLAIQMYTLDEEYGEFFPWATLTVNLPETRN